jgi:hypothetical protein
MPGLAPVAMHRGGFNSGDLGERERSMRDLYEAQSKDAITSEVPMVTEDPKFPGKPAKVFRIPRVHGFTYHFDMKREVKTLTGDVISPAERSSIEFNIAGSGSYGELVTADPRKIEVIETVLMKHRDFVHLGIIDYATARAAVEREQAHEDAKRLTDPSYLRKVVEQIKSMGVEAADTFAEILKPTPAPERKAGGNKPQSESLA